MSSFIDVDDLFWQAKGSQEEGEDADDEERAAWDQDTEAESEGSEEEGEGSEEKHDEGSEHAATDGEWAPRKRFTRTASRTSTFS